MLLTATSKFQIFLLSVFLYGLWIYFHAEPVLIGDEGHYIKLAHRLREGWYTNKEELDLWYGPGYPLLLSFFTYFTGDYMKLRLLNAILMGGSIYLLISTINFKLNALSIIVLIFTFFNFSAHKFICQTITEPFVFLLMTMFSILVIENKRPWTLGLITGILALTKVVFYFIMPIFLITTIIWSRNKSNGIKSLILYLFLSTPYLIYTNYISGKIYYPGTSGGANLYWQATSEFPLEGEWHKDIEFPAEVLNDLKMQNLLLKEKKKHGDVFSRSVGLNPVQRDSLLKRIAVTSIVSSPMIYINNSIKTMSRIFFDMPKSFPKPWYKNLIYLLNGILQIALLIIVLSKVKKMEFERLVLSIFVILYIGIHILLNGLTRQYFIITPTILVLVITTFFRNQDVVGNKVLWEK